MMNEELNNVEMNAEMGVNTTVPESVADAGLSNLQSGLIGAVLGAAVVAVTTYAVRKYKERNAQ